MSISSPLYRLLFSLSLVLGVAACQDEPAAPPGVPTDLSVPGPTLRSAAIPGYAVPTVDERAAAEYLARTLAMSLARPDLRLEIKMAIATSVMKEHKLHFASFLQGRGRIVSAMEGQDSSRITTVQSAVARVRELEFYMPVAAHREQWSGDENVLVGVLLLEKDSPIAFNTRGERMVLSPTVPPQTPTLFLVPNETNLSAQIPLNRQGRAAVACQSIASESLEAAATRCTGRANLPLAGSVGFVPGVRPSVLTPPSSVSGSFSDDPQIGGLRLEFLRVIDDGEPYALGDPEIEVHIVAKRSRDDGHIHDYQCSGEHAADIAGYQPGVRDQAYVFDQNDHFWNGSVLLLNKFQMDEIQQDEREGYVIVVYEDDNEACALHEDADMTLADLLNNVKAALPAGKVAVKVSSIGPGTAIAIGAALISIADYLRGGDDELGVLVDKHETSQYFNQYPDNTHVLLKENNVLNGRATIEVVSSGRLANVSGPSSAAPGQSAFFSASSAGTFGSVTYTFTATAPGESDPTVIQNGSSSGLYYSGWNQPGNYVIAVTVSDSYGSVGESSTSVMVNSVVISGANPVQVGCPAQYMAQPQYGTAPYTYSWTINGSPYDSGQNEYLTYTPPSEGAFTIGVSTTDANGVRGGTSQVITVTSGNCM
jgi:hypothetical protein